MNTLNLIGLQTLWMSVFFVLLENNLTRAVLKVSIIISLGFVLAFLA